MSVESNQLFRDWLRTQIDEGEKRISSEVSLTRGMLGDKLQQLGQHQEDKHGTTNSFSFTGSVIDLLSCANPEISSFLEDFWENVRAGGQTTVKPVKYHCFVERHIPKDLERKVGSDYVLPTPFYGVVFQFNRPEFGRFSLIIKESTERAEFYLHPQARVPIHKQRTQELITGVRQMSPLAVWDNYRVPGYSLILRDNPMVAAKLSTMFSQTVSSLIDQGNMVLDEVPIMNLDFGDNMEVFVEEQKPNPPA